MVVGLLVAACLISTPAHLGAQDEPEAEPEAAPVEPAPPSLESLLAPHVHRLEMADGRPAGPGGELLLERGRAAHFFLFGEQHATAEIARLGTALYRGLAPAGYRHAAIEVGPAGARRLEDLVRAEDDDALAAYFAADTNLLSIPFFFFQEEAELLRAVVETSGAAEPVLWGLDQEFIAGAGPALDRLAALAATEAERTAVATARAAAAENPMWVGAGAPETVAALADAFAGAESPEARELAASLVVSHRIYAPFTGRGGSVWAANAEREDLMKRLFLRHYQRVKARDGAPPRVFVKMGANHLFRGLSPTHVLTTGTFLHDLALMEGVEAFAVHVDCRGGEAMNPMSGAPAPCDSYVLGSGSALGAALPSDRMVVVDLAALRTEEAILRQLDEASRDLVWAYDAYVSIPDTTAATFFPGERIRFGG